ncbi:hypothetical protein JCM10207_002081 [Rhodosporidiobolus poonsookiae]
MSSTRLPSTTDSATANPRGIPAAKFLEDVPKFVAEAGDDAEVALKTLQDTLAKYRFMEQSALQRRAGLEEKVPELERTVEMVEVLIRKKEHQEKFETTFELADTLYAKGEVEEVDEVYIWLGASTMLSYPLDRALSLLTSKLGTARQSLLNAKDDLGWLKEQITVTEVNVARVYNFDVQVRREKREAEQEAEGKA